ncbi:MAG: glycoside hydrolase family 16 protein [Flavobacteriales bacterium]
MRYIIYLLVPVFFWSCEQTEFVNTGYRLVFEDNFNGETIDESVWNFETGTGCQYGVYLDGWGNSELQYYKKENATIQDTVLQIEAKEELVTFTHCNGQIQTRNYSSTRMNSKNKFDFIYGKIEASIKMDIKNGAWHAFWMLPSYPQQTWPDSGELDIVELSSRDGSIFFAGTMHHSGPQLGNEIDYNNDLGFFDDFHLYTLEWDRSSVRWYIDNELFHTVTKSSLSSLEENWPFSSEFHLILNTAVGGNLGGTPEFEGQSQYMLVDYVKVYQKISQ